MSNTRVQRKGERTVVYMDGQQLHGSGSNITISCGQGPSRSRGSVYRLPNEGPGTLTSETGVPSCLPGCRTTVSLENMASASSEPKIVRVVPRGTTILLEEVKAPPRPQSGRSNSRTGSPAIQIVEECGGGGGGGGGGGVQRRRTERRLAEGSRSQRQVVATVTTEFSEEDDDGDAPSCCPTCGGPLPPS